MRYILESGLPVDASIPEAVEGLRQPDPMVKHEAQGSMALKRLKVYFGTHHWSEPKLVLTMEGFLDWYYTKAVVARSAYVVGRMNGKLEAIGQYAVWQD
jgi:hypothetical protein